VRSAPTSPLLDPTALAAWLRAQVGEDVGEVVEVEVASAGRSNVTAVLHLDGGDRLVLRTPPPGDHPPTAHDVAREGRIMAAVGATDVPVPRVLGIEGSGHVLGRPFVVMAHVAGIVLDTAEDAAAVPAHERRSLGLDLARVLARLHRVEPAVIGLGDLARTDAFVARQLRRFTRQWRPVEPALDARFAAVGERLAARRPAAEAPARLVHGDYRVGNVLAAGGRVAAVLDWELATLGDPRSDLAYLLNNWVDAAEAADGPIASAIAAGGFGTRGEVVDAYEEALGAPVERAEVAYFRALAAWRLASIRSGVLDRLGGDPDPERRAKAAASGRSLPLLIDAAERLLDGDDT